MEQLPKIVQQRLQATAKAGIHPDPDLLTAFAEKSLNERERAQVLQHLGQCTDCRKVVSLAMPERTVPATFPARSTWLSWPVLRWSALAAGVLVVSAAVTLHYEGRQSAAPLVGEKVAEKAAAPAPPAAYRLESEASNQPTQKLAAKIVPPPFQSDRDFVVAGKLAKQREDTSTRSSAGASVINELETGRLENPRQESGQPGKDQRARDQLTGNRLAMADEVKSTDKPSALGQLAAGASAPVPAAAPASPAAAEPKSKTGDAEAQTKQPSDNFEYAARGSSETVTVQAEAAQITTSQATLGDAKENAKNESRKKGQKSGASGLKELPLVSRNVSDLGVVNKATPSWTLSPDGALQRSFDSGKTWQTIPVASQVVFRALAANDSDIWVGGTAGALYHSSDAGQHWTQIRPVVEGKPLTADIVTVQFPDAQHGKLTTADHEAWTTSDAGVSWHK